MTYILICETKLIVQFAKGFALFLLAFCVCLIFHGIFIFFRFREISFEEETKKTTMFSSEIKALEV